ncbi:MAG: pilus assembly protein PilP [Desulfatiglandales bacterium]
MYKKRANSIILSLLFSIAAIPMFPGSAAAEVSKKAIIKIPKDKETITEPSRKPIEEEIKVEAVEGEAKKDEEKVDYSYDPTNKVDPFKSFIVVKKELEEKEKEKPKTYLETLDISQVTLSAIVLGDKESWALVRDSKGDGHVIKVGTAIGTRGGRVIKILEKEVVVREYYTDMRDREEIPKDISIRLPVVD